MLGFFFAVFSAASLGLTAVTIRRGVLGSTPAIGTLITVVLGVPLFVVAALVTGQLLRAAEVTLPGYLALGATGMLQMVIGRYCFYRSIQAIGANQAELFQSIQIPVSIGIAMVLLGESFGLVAALAVAMIMAGPVLILLPKRPGASPAPAAPGKGASGAVDAAARPAIRMGEGLLFGALAIVAFSAGDVLARGVLADTGLGLLGGLTAYVSAAVVLLVLVVVTGRVQEVLTAPKVAARWFLLATVMGFLAQMSRYVALALAPVAVVVPLMRTVPVFVLLFSFLINRRLEVFGPRVVTGIILAVAGMVLMAL
ncbi:MAG: EamA family transporter [Dehalococcoidia bacterium]